MQSIFLSQHDYRGLSLTRLVRMRARVLAKYLVQALSAPLSRRRALRPLSGLKDVGCGREGILIALGPSAARIDPQRLRERQRQGAALIAINHYAASPLSEVIPDYYILADPAFFSTPWRDVGEREMAVWRYIRDHEWMRVFVPHTVDPPMPLHEGQLIKFNGLGLEGFTRNVSPMRARGFLSMTAYHGLSIAGHLGFNRILVTGIDNTKFRSLALTDDRRVGLGPNHFFDNGPRDVVPLEFFSDGVSAFFEDTARLFADLWLFARLPIENLDPHTLVDAFPIAPDFQDFSRELDATERNS